MALNVASMFGGSASVNNAANAQRMLSKALERLSSGQTVNTAADGPADLVISEMLRGQVGGIATALRNGQEAFNMAAVAEGGAGQVNDLLVRARELAVQAANGATTPEQRGVLQSELDNILQSIDRVANTARFAGEQLLDGSAGARRFQIGPDGDADSQATLNLPDVRTSQLGTAGGGAALETLRSGGANDLAANPAAAINIVDQAISETAAGRAEIGAFQQNTLQAAMNEMAVALENVTAMESSIRDLDFAMGIVEQMRADTLLRASLGALGQSNLQGQSILKLLGG